MFAKNEMGTWVGMRACKKHMITFDCCNVYTNGIHDVFNMPNEKINEFLYLCANTTFIYSQCITFKWWCKMTNKNKNGVASTHQTQMGGKMDGGMNAIQIIDKCIKMIDKCIHTCVDKHGEMSNEILHNEIAYCVYNIIHKINHCGINVELIDKPFATIDTWDSIDMKKIKAHLCFGYNKNDGLNIYQTYDDNECVDIIPFTCMDDEQQEIVDKLNALKQFLCILKNKINSGANMNNKTKKLQIPECETCNNTKCEEVLCCDGRNFKCAEKRAKILAKMITIELGSKYEVIGIDTADAPRHAWGCVFVKPKNGCNHCEQTIKNDIIPIIEKYQGHEYDDFYLLHVSVECVVCGKGAGF